MSGASGGSCCSRSSSPTRGSRPRRRTTSPREEMTGGLSRIVVELNFPIALVAIAITLVALSALPSAGWWAGGPAIALCAVTAVPGVVDQHDLDAGWVNAVPAAGVAIALGLTVVAARRAGTSFAARLRLDLARVVLAVVVLPRLDPVDRRDPRLLPSRGVFLMERPAVEDGVPDRRRCTWASTRLHGRADRRGAPCFCPGQNSRLAASPGRSGSTSRWPSPTAP